MKISFIHMQIMVHLRVNKTNFHMKRLCTRTRFETEATWKSPITPSMYNTKGWGGVGLMQGGKFVYLVCACAWGRGTSLTQESALDKVQGKLRQKVSKLVTTE